MARNETNRQSYQPIRDYGIIGDCHTAALVGRDGSIDWYCPGSFDAPAVFCRIVDVGKGGFFRVAPVGRFSIERHYLAETNILESIFTTDESRVRLTDFMPVHRRTVSHRGHDVGTSRRILRLLEGVAGEVELEICFYPTFDYAQGETTIGAERHICLAWRQGQYLSLASPGLDLKFAPDVNPGLYARLRLRAGDRRWLVLTYGDDPDRVLELPTSFQCDQQLTRTTEYWKSWAGKCTYKGPYRDDVQRSALTLKLLAYEPTGAIIAAPTTSLPEEIGGERNWDYRYAWIRDSTMILYALMNIGYKEEAADFFEWLLETHHKDPTPDLQVLYGIDGRRNIQETTLDHLEGYERSHPVRVGNAAAGQLQLDIYGEVLTAAYLYFRSGIGKSGNHPARSSTRQERLLKEDWQLLQALVNQAAKRWEEPDNGIWEVRGGLQSFLYSKLMCWAALDRGIRLAVEQSLQAPLEGWRNTLDSIRRHILTAGFSREKGMFLQSLGGSALDASTLLITRVGFLPATDSRVQSTVDRIRKELTHNGLVYRYRSADGLSGSEATFATCTFWLVDALALSGRLTEAHDLFERVAGYGNDLGLLSEEIDSESGALLGNFPQGFSHMGLINAAVNMAKAAKHGAEEHPETEAERAGKAAPAAAEGYSRP
jgi:GH15 family glucan-1,4-alpha-glucosidase